MGNKKLDRARIASAALTVILTIIIAITGFNNTVPAKPLWAMAAVAIVSAVTWLSIADYEGNKADVTKSWGKSVAKIALLTTAGIILATAILLLIRY
ncbi:MAG: hypothetical protein ACYDCW_07845 [Acidithiobacillus ferrivorans]